MLVIFFLMGVVLGGEGWTITSLGSSNKFSLLGGGVAHFFKLVPSLRDFTRLFLGLKLLVDCGPILSEDECSWYFDKLFKYLY